MEQEAMAILADLAARLYKLETLVAGNDRTFAELVSDGAELARRLATLETANLNWEDLVDARLDALEGTRQAVETIALAMYTAGRERNDLAQRLELLERHAAELARQPREWVRGGHGQLPDDAYDIGNTLGDTHP